MYRRADKYHLVPCQELDCEQFLRRLENVRLLSLSCAVNRMYRPLAIYFEQTLY